MRQLREVHHHRSLASCASAPRMLHALVPALSLAWRPSPSLPARPTLSSPILPIHAVTLACRRATPCVLAAEPPPPDAAPAEADAAPAEPTPSAASDTETVVVTGPFSGDSPLRQGQPDARASKWYKTTDKDKGNVPQLVTSALDFLWVPLVLVAILAQGRELAGNPMELNQFARGERAPMSVTEEAPAPPPSPGS